MTTIAWDMYDVSVDSSDRTAPRSLLEWASVKLLLAEAFFSDVSRGLGRSFWELQTSSLAVVGRARRPASPLDARS